MNFQRIFLAASFMLFAFGSNAVLANNLSKEDADAIATKCDEAAAFVNENHPETVLFRPKTDQGVWWCAVTDREGTLLAIRSSDTQEDGCTQTEFNSDAARLSELIAIAKAWATSFSNNEAAVDTRAVGVNSRIDQLGPPNGANVGTNAGAAPLWGVWVTNLLRHTNRASGYTCGERHFGVVPFAGECLSTTVIRKSLLAVPDPVVTQSTPTTS
jgi:hypothetical protein